MDHGSDFNDDLTPTAADLDKLCTACKFFSATDLGDREDPHQDRPKCWMEELPQMTARARKKFVLGFSNFAKDDRVKRHQQGRRCQGSREDPADWIGAEVGVLHGADHDGKGKP